MQYLPPPESCSRWSPPGHQSAPPLGICGSGSAHTGGVSAMAATATAATAIPVFVIAGYIVISSFRTGFGGAQQICRRFGKANTARTRSCGGFAEISCNATSPEQQGLVNGGTSGSAQNQISQRHTRFLSRERTQRHRLNRPPRRPTRKCDQLPGLQRAARVSNGYDESELICGKHREQKSCSSKCSDDCCHERKTNCHDAGGLRLSGPRQCGDAEGASDRLQH